MGGLPQLVSAEGADETAFRTAPQDEVWSLQKLGEPEKIEVRNTFIHFGSAESLRRALRKNNTDPSPPAKVAPPELETAAGFQTLRGQPPLGECGNDAAYMHLDFDFNPTPEASPRGCSEAKEVTVADHRFAAHSLRTPVSKPSVSLEDRHRLWVTWPATILLSPLVHNSPSQTSRAPAVPESPELTPEPKQLGSTPQRIGTKLSLLPAVPVFLEGDGFFFTLTLRRADDTGLGLHVEPTPDNRALLVHSIVSGGAIDAWNRQAAARGGAAASKAVQPGDKIACVNGCSEVQMMLSQIRSKLLLKIIVVRVANLGPCSELREIVLPASPQVVDPGKDPPDGVS